VFPRDISEVANTQKRDRVMKVLIYLGSCDVRVEEVPDPKLEKATDVLLKITSTNI